MAVQVFTDNDSAYRRWRDSHRGAYIVNVDRELSDPAGMRIHRATCGSLRDGAGGGVALTETYIKACSTDPRELDRWSHQQLGVGLRALRCKLCEPSSLGLT